MLPHVQHFSIQALLKVTRLCATFDFLRCRRLSLCLPSAIGIAAAIAVAVAVVLLRRNRLFGTLHAYELVC